MENISLQANKMDLAYLIPCDQDNKESDIFIYYLIKIQIVFIQNGRPFEGICHPSGLHNFKVIINVRT